MPTFSEFYDAGNIPEDVIRAFYDISPTDVRFSGGVEQQGADSVIKEFFEHTLAAPNKDNAAPDGGNTTADDTSLGDRRLNHCQLMERGIRLGDQAEASDGFGPNITKFDTQLEFRTQELYRDFEASTLSENASVAGVGAAADGTGGTAAKSAGFFAWVATNTVFGAGGDDGGWEKTTSGIVDSPTPGAVRALSETDINTVMAEINVQGGRPDQLQMIPQLKSRFSDFMFTSSARIGAIYTPTSGGEGGATAVASIQMYEHDFGSCEVIANNIMQAEVVGGAGTGRTNLGIVDTQYWAVATQWDPRAKRLGTTGHGEKWLASCSKTLLALNERSSGSVRDIDYNVDMTV